MELPKEQPLPTGHKPIENGNPENCPFLQINKNVDEKLKEMDFNKLSSSKIDPKNNLKNDSDSDLSDDEAQGPQSACPFMPSFKKRNPDLGHFSEGYE